MKQNVYASVSALTSAKSLFSLRIVAGARIDIEPLLASGGVVTLPFIGGGIRINLLPVLHEVTEKASTVT